MKRIEDHQLAMAYRRLVVTTLPLGIAAFGLIVYRWYTFFTARDYTSVANNIFAQITHLSQIMTFRYWVDSLRTIRESLPMVETTLFVVSILLVGIFLWKLIELRSLGRSVEYAGE
jgi:hypothetical protein